MGSAAPALWEPAGWPCRTSGGPETTSARSTTPLWRWPWTRTGPASWLPTRTLKATSRTSWCTWRTHQITASGTAQQVGEWVDRWPELCASSLLKLTNVLSISKKLNSCTDGTKSPPEPAHRDVLVPRDRHKKWVTAYCTQELLSGVETHTINYFQCHFCFSSTYKPILMYRNPISTNWDTLPSLALDSGYYFIYVYQRIVSLVPLLEWSSSNVIGLFKATSSPGDALGVKADVLNCL